LRLIPQNVGLTLIREQFFSAIMNNVGKVPGLLLIILLLGVTGCQPRNEEPENGTPGAYYIQNKGSDTLVNLALAWAERYQVVRPDVRLAVTGGGSGTGIAAILNGTVDIANASRRISPEEIRAAELRGITPVEFVVAQDAIAVVVNLQNPVDQLTIQQISAIYSGAINNWREVGGEDRPIVRLSRETNSGTHVYFLEEVLRQGDPDDTTLFSQDTLLLPSSEGITHEVKDNPNAIGYEGLGYITPDMKVLAIARNPGEAYVMPTIETVNDDSYPIARDLYLYTPGEPTGVVAEYMNWILDVDAQQIVVELGFVPVLTD
jgi:phosphate transport system substrate-binding protein